MFATFLYFQSRPRRGNLDYSFKNTQSSSTRRRPLPESRHGKRRERAAKQKPTVVVAHDSSHTDQMDFVRLDQDQIEQVINWIFRNNTVIFSETKTSAFHWLAFAEAFAMSSTFKHLMKKEHRTQAPPFLLSFSVVSISCLKCVCNQPCNN